MFFVHNSCASLQDMPDLRTCPFLTLKHHLNQAIRCTKEAPLFPSDTDIREVVRLKHELQQAIDLLLVDMLTDC